MNRKYIDFVPKNETTGTRKPVRAVVLPENERVVGKSATRRGVDRIKSVSDAKPAKNMRVMKEARAMKAKKVAMKPSAVIGDGMIRSAMKRTLRTKKSARVARAETRVEENEVLERALTKANNLDQTLKVSQTRFVNTDKVVKRPLSKNVYQKKIVEPKEVPQGPVTIIQKPEKDSRVGLIVTIIITIILGAAAGTVAFLLLPK